MYIHLFIYMYLSQIAKAAGMGFLREELLVYFGSKMAPYISQLQGSTHRASTSGSKSTPPKPTVSLLDAFGEELIECFQSLDVYEVTFHLHMYDTNISLSKCFS